MPQPLLHLGDVGAMFQSIGGSRRPQGMHAKTQGRPGKADQRGIEPEALST
jgi:hypothetical protein